MLNRSLALSLLALTVLSVSANRSLTTLNEGWQFSKGHLQDANCWQNVRVPHDWAIYGPFDRVNDLQEVAVEQNGETEKTWHTGRTGGLPFIGKGTYRTNFEVTDTTDGRRTTIIFDGAMSNPHIIVNGKEIGKWANGYNSFYYDVTDAVSPGDNELVVELENYDQSSRWYPGAGLYRNVHVLNTNRIHIPVWGTFVTTPNVKDDYATVNLRTRIEGTQTWEKVIVYTQIIDPNGNVVAECHNPYVDRGLKEISQNFVVNSPSLWDLDNPALYTARTILTFEDKVVDSYDTRFGIRTIEFVPEKGFFLNGKETKFKGVCNHHDLGPLGAAVNRSAFRHRIELLKDMGANAIRTSHNMPAPELVELCDEMGMMMIVEAFDDWSFSPKSPNGYGKVFAEWHDRDLTNMVEHFRNSPSVIMWSIGNEVRSQWGEDGVKELVQMQDLVHSLDSTRPVTCGMENLETFENGFGSAIDIPGYNYKPQYNDWVYEIMPQHLVMATESASTVSSRGKYYFPVEFDEHHTVIREDLHSNSYDNESCPWSNTPDLDFAEDDDKPWVIGQFVWTGFDYLGEPSPYDTDAWPSHSSYFGIIDLASLPKDRYYLYRSQWNKTDETLHILPHWTWPGREGLTTPVFVYTSYPEAELFVNGVSQGRKRFDKSNVIDRYRLRWNDVIYQPGEIKVVAYNDKGEVADTKSVRTAKKPYALKISSNRSKLTANGDDIVYVTITAIDKNDNIVPDASNLINFQVEGSGSFEATANGDPTCLMSFQKPEIKLFSGVATAILRSANTAGPLKLKVTSKGLKPATITIDVR